MKILNLILTIVILSSLITIINADERKRSSPNLYRERLRNLLVEAQRREMLYNKFKESEKEFQRSINNLLNEESDEDNYGRTYVRRKVVGISDNPF